MHLRCLGMTASSHEVFLHLSARRAQFGRSSTLLHCVALRSGVYSSSSNAIGSGSGLDTVMHGNTCQRWIRTLPSLQDTSRHIKTHQDTSRLIAPDQIVLLSGLHRWHTSLTRGHSRSPHRLWCEERVAVGVRQDSAVDPLPSARNVRWDRYGTDFDSDATGDFLRLQHSGRAGTDWAFFSIAQSNIQIYVIRLQWFSIIFHVFV